MTTSRRGRCARHVGTGPIGVALACLIVAGSLVSPFGADAQQTAKIPTIGLLVTGPPPEEHVCVLSFRRGLADLGYVEGRTHALEIRWGEGRPEETLPRFARELVQLGVAVVTTVTSQGLVEAKPELAPVPVVMAVSNYPVERGLVQSLSRPGGNITGMATFTSGTFEKRMQLLAEAVPRVSRVAVLRLSGDQNDFIVRDLERSAQRLGLRLQVIEVRRPLKQKLPSFSGEPTAAKAGVLMSAGASISASCHRAATYVDRILKGTKPSDLPLEQSTRLGLEINLKTAKALGLVIPSSVLLRADHVIE